MLRWKWVLAVLVSASAFSTGLGSQPDILWERYAYYDGPLTDDPWTKVVEVLVDDAENVYAIGQIAWDDGGAPGEPAVLFIAKWSASGDLAWADTFDQPDAFIHPYAASFDHDGNIVVVGSHRPPGGNAWPDWLFVRVGPDGGYVDGYYGNDSAWRVLHSVDINDEGNAVVCGNNWASGVFVGEFDFETGDWVWGEEYSFTPDTTTIKYRVVGKLGDDGFYYFGKNVTSSGIGYSVIAKVSASDGTIEDSAVYDFGESLDELPTGFGFDEEGNVVGVAYLVNSSSAVVFKLQDNLGLIWSTAIHAGTAPYLFPKRVAVGTSERVYVVSREGEDPDWWNDSPDSHVRTTCTTGEGAEIWSHSYDAGGPGSHEHGDAGGVACSADDTELYVGASLGYSGTEWRRAMVVLKYAKTLYDTSAIFRVESLSGDVHADQTLHAASLAAGAADVAEWVSVPESVGPGSVLELDPDSIKAYQLSQTACSQLVAGVVSTEPGITLGVGTGQVSQYALLALTGIVPVKVTNEGGRIRAGDLLVSSSTPGHAMRWDGTGLCPCALVGKAMGAMEDDRGTVLALLTAH